MYICSAEDLHSYLGETEGLILVDRYVSELPLVRIKTTLLYVATSESVYPLIPPPPPPPPPQTKKLQDDRHKLFHENEAQASELREFYTIYLAVAGQVLCDIQL